MSTLPVSIASLPYFIVKCIRCPVARRKNVIPDRNITSSNFLHLIEDNSMNVTIQHIHEKGNSAVPCVIKGLYSQNCCGYLNINGKNVDINVINIIPNHLSSLVKPIRLFVYTYIPQMIIGIMKLLRVEIIVPANMAYR